MLLKACFHSKHTVRLWSSGEERSHSCLGRSGCRFQDSWWECWIKHTLDRKCIQIIHFEKKKKHISSSNCCFAVLAPVKWFFWPCGLEVPRQSFCPGSLCHEEFKYTSRKSMCSKHMHSNHQPGHLQDNLSLLFCRLTIGSNVSILYRKKKINLLKDILRRWKGAPKIPGS